MSMDINEFYKRYKPMHEALLKLEHKDLGAVAAVFAARYPVESDQYSKIDTIDRIWEVITRWRKAEEELQELRSALGVVRKNVPRV